MTSPEELFAAGGTTGRLMARLDWSGTALGPVAGWSQSLRAAVRTVLSSRYPMLLLWGPELVQLYNDAYSALIGDKHPAALGLDVRITLAEGWDVLGPLIDEAMATGVASWVPALQLLLDRAGFREEAYFSVSHAPARDDDGRTAGVLTVCSEVTEQVVGERRLRLLRDLALPGGTGLEQTCERLCAVIGEHPLDVPFAAVYLRDGAVLRRYAAVGADASALPDAVPLDAAGDDSWGLRAAAGGSGAAVDDVLERFLLPGGAFGDPVRVAVAEPLPSADRSQPVGVLLTGLSPSRAADETYRSFVQLLAQQVAVAVRNARAYQEERDRAAALAELDRVKTEFFTNVSHEFRTPLTLMLGPLADALADRAEPLGPAQHARVDTARRNATRLLTLVNELLTFASVGAGAAGTAPRVLDLAAFTADLAGVFRAAVERTGLRLVVRCPPLPRPVAVDPAHWEKIVTNLLSNALKFTFVGEIRVSLDADAAGIRLRVADTGIGIDAAELPLLFDRFHRVRGARSRSHEGTGIGLALVRELARLEGGDVEVSSVPGRGATFDVVLPWAAVAPGGAPELETVPDRLAGARAAVSVSAGWTAGTPVVADGRTGKRILVADDNGDMRDYLARLLAAQGWRVQTVTDGEAALQAIRLDRPDLLITDVMMPRLDGFALVRVLRGDEATRDLPVVMLSARAGQESGVEGFAAGADDYVVKPFHAGELIARVRSTLELASVRAAPGRPTASVTGVAAAIAAGRALEAAFRVANELVRVLANAVSAVTVLDGDDARPALSFESERQVPPSSGSGSESPASGSPLIGSGPLSSRTAEIRDRDGVRIGAVTVSFDHADPPGELLDMAAAMLGALARSTADPEQQRLLTLALQQSVLPVDASAPDGLTLHTAYRPAAIRAGGDWYDLLDAPDGTLLISVGDVAGHGPAAAVASGLLRSAVRSRVAAGQSPAQIVTGLSELLSTLLSATLLVVAVDPGDGRLVWCSAGHPAPLHSAPGAVTRSLSGVVGAPLGQDGGDYREHAELLGPGDQLVLFTDGLADGPAELIDSGLERLRRRCQDEFAAGSSLSALVEAVLAQVRQPQEDDVAVVAVRRLPSSVPAAVDLAPVDVAWTYPLDPTAAAAAAAISRTSWTSTPIFCTTCRSRRPRRSTTRSSTRSSRAGPRCWCGCGCSAI
ncbi:SpoIIE family protein phosphatase [Actinoplanes awajinensis]|uniref:SpoIIE family protein phosphatase n=1 Tax=Actinoplanes awajinensis TaxID=135946 RepID=UPI000B0680FF|nr:SpoIIE family protein phosphatase [Actinoplanes awajinensis]